jgi:hypothetical protein
MALFPEREQLKIPEAEGSEAKEVFAFFGLCSYSAQVLEQGLVNLAVALRVRGLTQLTGVNFDSLFHQMGKKTLGQLITDVRRQIQVSDELERAIEIALLDRNYLAHNFFVTHDIDFMSNSGRMKMIEELRQIAERVRNVDRDLELITHPLWERLGLTPEIIKAGLDKMKAEARQLDEISDTCN